MPRRSTRDAESYEEGHGLGGFLRSLLSGIPWSDSADSEEVFNVDVPPSRRLRIANANGRTRIVGEDRADIEVGVKKHARAESDEAAERLLAEIRVEPRLAGEDLEIEVEIPRRWNRHGQAHLELRVPRDLETWVKSANGKLCLAGLRGPLHAKSSNGKISVTDVVGDIRIMTSNAAVCCQCTCGRLQARSSNGKIELGDHRGSIDASTSNGLIRAQVDELGKDGVLLATSNGRIVLELPDEVDADLDMRVDNGVIRNDREVLSETRSDGRVRGILGHGGSLIKLRTSNGTISLR